MTGFDLSRNPLPVIGLKGSQLHFPDFERQVHVKGFKVDPPLRMDLTSLALSHHLSFQLKRRSG